MERNMSDEAKELLTKFQCEYNRSLEETFARTLAEEEDVRLFFVNDNQAWTDGRNIVVDPAMDRLFYDREGLDRIEAYLKWPKVVLVDPWNVLRLVTRAQTIHECLHLLYTDMPGSAARDPKCATRNKRKTMNSIANIIEDAYIEAVGCSCYDNMEFYLKFGRVSHLLATHPGEGTAMRLFDTSETAEPSETDAAKTEEKEKLSPEEREKREREARKAVLLMLYLDHMACVLLYPMIDAGEILPELAPYVEKTRQFFFDGSAAAKPAERYAYASKIFDVILPLIPDDSISLDTEKLERLLGGTKTHTGGAGIGGDERKGREQTVTVRLFMNRDGSERDDGAPIAQLMAALKEFARDKTLAFEVILDTGRYIPRNGGDFGGALHRDIRINEYHPAIDTSFRQAYRNIYRKYSMSIHSYNGRFADILKARRPQREDGQYFGSGISSRSLGDIKKRYWYRTVEGVAVPDMAVLLLIDGSGSMRGKRCHAAREAAVILHEVLTEQDIPHAVVEHRAEGYDPEIDVNVLVGFHGRKGEKYNLMRIHADGNTRDGLALYWAARYIKKQTANERRLILVISDGVPEHCYDEYFPPVSTQDTARAVKKIRKSGTEVIAVSLDDPGGFYCYDALSAIYPHLIACNDLTRLTGQLLGVIAKLLR